MITFAEVSIGIAGDTPCVRCARATETSMRAATRFLKRSAGICESWSCGPGPNISLVGAEPFAHPDLPTLVQGAMEAGCERLRLRTDAGALAVGGNAAGVIGAGVRQLEVVLLGGDAATHDALVGRAGALAATTAGVSAFLSAAAAAGANVAVVGRIPVCPHVRDGLLATVHALAGMGAVAIELATTAGVELTESQLSAARQAAVVNGAWLQTSPMRPGLPGSPWHLLGERA